MTVTCLGTSIENVEHLLMHCPYFNDRKEAMLREINDLENDYDTVILTSCKAGGNALFQ